MDRASIVQMMISVIMELMTRYPSVTYSSFSLQHHRNKCKNLDSGETCIWRHYFIVAYCLNNRTSLLTIENLPVVINIMEFYILKFSVTRIRSFCSNFFLFYSSFFLLKWSFWALVIRFVNLPWSKSFGSYKNWQDKDMGE